MKIEIIIHPSEIEHLRKSLNACMLHYIFTVKESATQNTRTLFTIEADDPAIFFHIGKNFGIISEFNSFDHRERKTSED